jgi:hypothetical protein
MKDINTNEEIHANLTGANNKNLKNYIYKHYSIMNYALLIF